MQENAKPEPINRNLESLGLLSEGGGGGRYHTERC